MLKGLYKSKNHESVTPNNSVKIYREKIILI